MRVGAVVAVTLAGCGTIRYTGTEEQMQQVARGAAEMMKKNPYGDAVSAAGTGAHMALSMAIGGEAAAKVDCTPGLNGCYVKDTAGTAQAAGVGMDSFTGLQNDFYKTTSIGKD